ENDRVRILAVDERAEHLHAMRAQRGNRLRFEEADELGAPRRLDPVAADFHYHGSPPGPVMGYGSAAIAFHWLTAALVVSAYVFGLGGSEQQVYARENDFNRAVHEALGMSVLLVAAVRLAWKAAA